MSYSDKSSALDAVLDNLHKLPDDRKSVISENAENIFAKIPNKTNGKKSNVGLIVGKIQSGKTSNMIALTAHAFDNGYRMAIMILSDTNNLLDQNCTEIKNAFIGIDSVQILKEARFDGDFKGITSKELDYLYDSGTNLIICTLKHRMHIDEINKVIYGTKYANDFSLIFDDESDDASQNTSTRKFVGLKDIENDRSATNRAITDLKDSLKQFCYLSVTATPEANILLQKFQDLAPDFCYGIEPGSGYRGLIDYHLPDNDKIELIEDFSKKKFEESPTIPNSLYNAFCFFVAGIIYRFQTKRNFKQSFLIHISEKIINHQNLYGMLDRKISDITYDIKHRNEGGEDFISDVQTQYLTFSADVENVSFESIERILDGLKLHCINSQSDQNNLNKAMAYLPYHIIVGGNMLDRGIAVEGLSVAYMTREAVRGQVDTLLQRARWFGYREDYFEICRVYLTKGLREQYEDLIETDESVWEYITFCELSDSNMKNFDPKIVIEPSRLKPTNPRKALYEYSEIGFNFSQSYIVHNKEYNDENIRLLKQYEIYPGRDVSYSDYQTHKYIELNVRDLKHILRSYRFHQDDPEFGNVENIIYQIDELGLPDNEPIDFVIMRYKEAERRSMVEGTTKIVRLLQGHSVGLLPGDPGYYPGDRYIVGDRLMLQVHHVILKKPAGGFYEEGDEVPFLSLIFPQDYKRRSIVTRTDVSSDPTKKY